MLIALLAVLGVDLIVLVAFAASLFARKRWVKRQPGDCRGVIEDTELLIGPYLEPADATAAGSERV